MGLLQFITYAGIFVFALTGAFKARSYKMDVFGGIVLAFVTAYGGGTLRDLLIGVKPVNWINDNIALVLVFAGTAFTFLLKENVSRFKRTIFYTDAIGLGLFTAWGIEVALRNSLNDIYSLVMGVITATVGGGIYLLLKHIPVEYNINLAVCVIVVVGIRIYSKRKR